MSNKKRSPRKAISLAEMVESIETSENPALELLERTIQQARASDPELAEVLRSAAIPRRFDADVLGVLRAAPDAYEENKRLLEKVIEYSFVVPHAQGGYTYHDNARDLLLQQWQADEAGREAFEQLTRRLVAHHERSFEHARHLQDLLEQLRDPIRRANPERLVQIAGGVEQQLLGSLVESLYYEELMSGPSVRSFIDRHRDPIERDGRIGRVVAKTLHDYLGRLQEHAQDDWYLWLRYWEARLLHGLGRHRALEAERLLRDLLPSVEHDATLNLWVLSTLGYALQDQDRLVEAGHIFRQELAKAEETRVDEWNLPGSYSRIAALEYTMDRLGLAAEQYEKAREAADRLGNITLRISSRTDLASVRCESGDQLGAIESAFEALEIARTHSPKSNVSPAMHAAIAARFMQLFARREAQLLDTVHAEAVELSPVPTESTQMFDLTSQYIDYLREGGQLRRATQELSALMNHPAIRTYPSAKLQALFRSAMVLGALGDLDGAIDNYTKVIAEAERVGFATIYDTTAATTNRGKRLVEAARWQEADADLAASVQRWEEMGHERLVALLRAYQADALSGQGQFTEAEQLFDRVRNPMLTDVSLYEPIYHHLRGHLYQRQSRWDEARVCFELALAINRSRQDDRESGKDLIHLITVAARHARWDDASRLAAEAIEAWRRLAEMDRYVSTPERQEADAANARGLWTLLAGRGDRQHDVVRACDLFQRAIESAPGNVWYRLNLSYAKAELGDWAEAARALEPILEVQPDWFPGQWLRTRLAHCHLQHGAALAAAGRHRAALQVLLDTHSRFEGALSAEQLLSLHVQAGDSSLHVEAFEVAASHYSAALAEAVSKRAPHEQARYQARLALVAAVRMDFLTALVHLYDSLALHQGDAPTDAAKSLVRLLSEPVRTRSEYEAGKDVLRLLADDPALPFEQARTLRMGVLELTQRGYGDRRGRSPAAQADGGEQTTADPILVRLDAGLYPDGQEDPKVKWLLQEGIPALRERILRTTGVRLPWIQMRASNELSDGAYIVLLDGVPLATGTVRAGLHPMDGERDLLAHLERLLLGHLSGFLGIQELRWMLDVWAAEAPESRDAVLARGVPDDAALVRLLRVLHDLLDEGVSIRNMDSILRAVAEVAPRYTEPLDVVEHVRIAVRADLPDVHDKQLVVLSPELEEMIHKQLQARDGKRFLAVPLQEIAAVRQALLAEVAKEDPRSVAVVVRTPGLRPFVRRLVERDLPGVPVLARRELQARVDGDAGADSGSRR